MKQIKYIAALITILGTTWLNAQINPGANNSVTGGNSSVAGGDFNKMSGDYGIIGSGARNTNVATHGSIGGGKFNMVRTDFSTIPGGKDARTRSYGQMAYASGSFANNGDAQLAFYVLRGTTVGAVQSALWLDGTSENITITNNGSFIFDIDIVARSSTSVNSWYGNFFHYRVALENQNGALSWATMDQSSITNHNAAVTVTSGSSGNQFILYGNGEASETIYWVATVRATELIKP